MIVAHVSGFPVEETVLQLVAAGALTLASVTVAAEVTVRRLRSRLRRR